MTGALFSLLGTALKSPLGRLALKGAGSMAIHKLAGSALMTGGQQQRVGSIESMQNLFSSPGGMGRFLLNQRAFGLRDQIANMSAQGAHFGVKYAGSVGGADIGFQSMPKIFMGARFGGVFAASPQATRAYGQEYASAELSRRFGEVATRGVMNLADLYTGGLGSAALRYSGAEASLLGKRNIRRNVEQLSMSLNAEDLGGRRVSTLGRGIRRGLLDDEDNAGVNYAVEVRRGMHIKYGYSTEQIDRMERLAGSSMTIGQIKRSARKDQSLGGLAVDQSDLGREFAATRRNLNMTSEEVKGLFDTLTSLGDVTAKGAEEVTRKLRGYRRTSGADIRQITGLFKEQTMVAGQNFLGKNYGDYTVQGMIQEGRSWTNRSVPQELMQYFGGDTSRGRRAYAGYMSGVGTQMLDTSFGRMTSTLIHTGRQRGLGLSTNYGEMMNRFSGAIADDPYAVLRAQIDPEARGATAAAAPAMKIQANVDLIRKMHGDNISNANVAAIAAGTLERDFGTKQLAGAKVKSYLMQEDYAKNKAEYWGKVGRKVSNVTGKKYTLGKDFHKKLMYSAAKNKVDVKDVAKLAQFLQFNRGADSFKEIEEGTFDYESALAIKEAVTSGSGEGSKAYAGIDLTDTDLLKAVNSRYTVEETFRKDIIGLQEEAFGRFIGAPIRSEHVKNQYKYSTKKQKNEIASYKVLLKNYENTHKDPVVRKREVRAFREQYKRSVATIGGKLTGIYDTTTGEEKMREMFGDTEKSIWRDDAEENIDFLRKIVDPATADKDDKEKIKRTLNKKGFEFTKAMSETYSVSKEGIFKVQDINITKLTALFKNEAFTKKFGGILTGERKKDFESLVKEAKDEELGDDSVKKAKEILQSGAVSGWSIATSEMKKSINEQLKVSRDGSGPRNALYVVTVDSTGKERK